MHSVDMPCKPTAGVLGSARFGPLQVIREVWHRLGATLASDPDPDLNHTAPASRRPCASNREEPILHSVDMRCKPVAVGGLGSGKKYGTTHLEHVHRGINGTVITVLRNHDKATENST